MSDVFGPIDYLILEFPRGVIGTETTKALSQLVDRGLIRLYDVMIVRKEADGTAEEVDIAGGTADIPAVLATFAGARSGMLGYDDVREAAGALDPGTSALVVVYENRWAVPFVAAARSEGAEVVASARLSAQEIMDALDTAEAVG